MTRLIYGLTGSRQRRLSIAGFRNEKLRLVAVGHLAAIVGELSRVPKVTPRNIREYHAVLQRLWLALPAILPARYPTSIDDLEELKVILRTRGAALGRTMRDVRNRGQMTVRIVTESAVVESGSSAGKEVPSSGLAYLQSRALAAARALRVPEFEPLRPVVRRWIRAERVEKRGNVATIYHLVPRASATRYRRAIETGSATAGVRAIVTGPFPPYAFADDILSGQR